MKLIDIDFDTDFNIRFKFLNYLDLLLVWECVNIVFSGKEVAPRSEKSLFEHSVTCSIRAAWLSNFSQKTKKLYVGF